MLPMSNAKICFGAKYAYTECFDSFSLQFKSISTKYINYQKKSLYW